MIIKRDTDLAVSNMLLEDKRYNMTLKCILAIKYECDNGDSQLRFVGSEIPFKYKNKEAVSPQPDLICQESDVFGIYGEIKSSITAHDLGINKILRGIKRLENDLIGWDTENNEIKDFSIWLLIFKESIEPFLSKLKEAKIKRNILVSTWERVNSLKYNSDIFKIQKSFGELGAGKQALIPDNFEVEEDSIFTDYENIKFFRQNPPPIYMIDFLWMDIFPSFSDGDNFKVGVIDLYRKIKEYYPMWANIPGEQEQIKMKWIKNSLDILSKIGLCKREEGDVYEIYFNKNLGRNFKKKIAIKMCSKISGVKEKYLPQQKKLK